MSLHRWLQNLRSALIPGQDPRHKRRRCSPRASTHRLNLEILEERRVLASWVSGDFNNDGHLDVLTGLSSAYEAEISVELSNDDGSLRSPYSYVWDTGWEGNTVVDMVVNDFDADGNLDVAVSVGGSYSAVAVLFGNGAGWFYRISQLYPANRYIPHSIVVSDFNHDSRADLAWGNLETDAVEVAVNNGDGTFRPLQSYATAEDPWYLAVADPNGDGHPDLVAGNSVLLGNGDGTFQDALLPPVLRIGDATVTEGNSGTIAATFIVTLSKASTETVTVALRDRQRLRHRAAITRPQAVP